ncbi:MAG TPA: DUF3179 domain-containing protein [Rhodospirillales bacterium]|nr:DUF3179 domain-containing protein [Rhodospirillales bacterium]
MVYVVRLLAAARRDLAFRAPRAVAAAFVLMAFAVQAAVGQQCGFRPGMAPQCWQSEWPKTDFSKHSVSYREILSGGPSKDGIPSIENPKFLPVSEIAALGGTDPVIGITVNGDARAYPLQILTRHEIVNDVIGGVPVAVTYCPLCNSGIVFDRRLEGRVLEFGTTGKLRHSDLVMYDRQTESWWQQFMGEAIIGELTGNTLKMLPARMESLAHFRKRAPQGRVQVPGATHRQYGVNPYAFYDSQKRPYGFFTGHFPDGIGPMVRVVAVGKEAWSLPLLRGKRKIVAGDLVLSWEAGQNSALDSPLISKGRDVGNVIVRRRVGEKMEDVVHDVTFAFVIHAFRPDGVIHK